MEFFLDTANVDDVKEMKEFGLISGVTTNPTLIAREGRDFEATIKEIADIVDGPVNAEAVGETAEEIVAEARVMASWAGNVVIKIPVCAEGLKAVNRLSGEGIATNVTLVFTSMQALAAARAGADYVCPFVGRLDDVASSGIALLDDIMQIFWNYGVEARVVGASIRHPMHVVEAARIGVDILTVPCEVLKRLIDHPLTRAGIDKFLEDHKKVMGAD